MKKIILLIAAMTLATSSAVLANSTSDGCGLGWEVTSKQTFIATTTRGTTNYFIPPTFGMTSGTMGCAKHDFAKRDQEAAVFASTNYEPLKLEMAQGQGEYLTGLARTMGCSDAVSADFGRMTQKNYDSLSNSASGVEMFKKVKNEVRKNPILASNCNA